MLLLGCPKARNEIVNIGSEEEVQIAEVAKLIAMEMGIKQEIDYLAAPEGSARRRCPDITKLKNLTSYRPKVNLLEGIRRTLESYA